MHVWLFPHIHTQSLTHTCNFHFSLICISFAMPCTGISLKLNICRWMWPTFCSLRLAYIVFCIRSCTIGYDFSTLNRSKKTTDFSFTYRLQSICKRIRWITNHQSYAMMSGNWLWNLWWISLSWECELFSIWNPFRLWWNLFKWIRRENFTQSNIFSDSPDFSKDPMGVERFFLSIKHAFNSKMQLRDELSYFWY